MHYSKPDPLQRLLQTGVVGDVGPDGLMHGVHHPLKLRKMSPAEEQDLRRRMAETYPLVPPKVLDLIKDFLAFKRTYGSSVEKALYQNMTVESFITRLMLKRPACFYDETDIYTLRDGTKGRGGWERIGTDAENDPHYAGPRLKDYISYDEAKISAFLGASSRAKFINDGDRHNAGVPGKEKGGEFEEAGVMIGQVGARLEKPGAMEYQHMVITSGQNTKEKGYGSNPPDSAAAREKKMWAKFYGVPYFPTYAEVIALSKEPGSPFIPLGNGSFLHKDVYKARMREVVELFLREANAKGKEAGKQVYAQATGLGLGVWCVTGGLETQTKLLLEVYEEVLDQCDFPYISDVDFSWFNEGRKCGQAKRHNASPHTAAFGQGKNPEVNIHFSKRAMSARLPGKSGSKLLVTQFAWDGVSWPGNEYWNRMLTASGDPAAASCSDIDITYNPILNPGALTGQHALQAQRKLYSDAPAKVQKSAPAKVQKSAQRSQPLPATYSVEVSDRTKVRQYGGASHVLGAAARLLALGQVQTDSRDGSLFVSSPIGDNLCHVTIDPLGGAVFAFGTPKNKAGNLRQADAHQQHEPGRLLSTLQAHGINAEQVLKKTIQMPFGQYAGRHYPCVCIKDVPSLVRFAKEAARAQPGDIYDFYAAAYKNKHISADVMQEAIQEINRQNPGFDAMKEFQAGFPGVSLGQAGRLQTKAHRVVSQARQAGGGGGDFPMLPYYPPGFVPGKQPTKGRKPDGLPDLPPAELPDFPPDATLKSRGSQHAWEKLFSAIERKNQGSRVTGICQTATGFMLTVERGRGTSQQALSDQQIIDVVGEETHGRRSPKPFISALAYECIHPETFGTPVHHARGRTPKSPH